MMHKIYGRLTNVISGLSICLVLLFIGEGFARVGISLKNDVRSDPAEF